MICLIVGLIKIISLYKMTHFPEPFDYTFKKLSLELNLVSYATKSALKKKTGINAWKFVKKLI